MRELVLDVISCKMARHTSPVGSSIVAYATAEYEGFNRFRSKEMNLTTGARFVIPEFDRLSNLRIEVFAVEGPVTVSIGSCNISDFNKFIESPIDLTLDVHYGRSVRVGRLLCKSFVIAIEKGDGRRRSSSYRVRYHNTWDDALQKMVPPNFFFRPLTRAVNWDRIKGVDLNRYA